MRKFALVGCGRIAEKHAATIVKEGQLLAVCDVTPEKADSFAERFKARPYYQLDALLAAEKEVEIVVVCTPNGFHAEHAIKSLQAKKHVLCEKPLCLTTAAAWQIIETEKFCRRKLFLVKSARHNPILKTLKKAITEGTLGTLYSFHLSCLWNRPKEYFNDWKGKHFPDGGTLYTQFSHYIDAMVWLFGDVVAVKGFKENKAHQGAIEFEDTGTAALQLESGTLGTLHWSVNAYRSNHEIALTILAEQGTIRIGGEYLQEVQYQLTRVPLHLPGWDDNFGIQSGSNLPLSHHAAVYDQLLQALDGGDSGFTGAYEGLKTVASIEKIYKAIS